MTTVRNEIYRDGVLVAVEEAPDPDLAPGAAIAAAAEALTAAIPDPLCVNRCSPCWTSSRPRRPPGEPMNTNNRNTTCVSAVAVAGALATIIAWAAKQAGLDVPPEVVAALTTVLAVVVGVLVPGSDR